jgi:hypothetical protein
MAIYSAISIGMINAGISSKKRNYHLREDLFFFSPSGCNSNPGCRRKVLQELGPLPDFVTPVLARIADLSLSPPPNHLLVNEYEPGQGIMPHTGQFNEMIA